MSVWAGWKRRQAGLGAALLLIGAGLANAATGTQKVAEIPPTVRIPVGPLGFVAPSPAYLNLRYALTTLHFVDNGHLLFTFHVNGLMKRIPNDDADDHDQVIHAEVVDIASGKVTEQTDWRMHDRQVYLWALNDGKFLVRSKNSLYLTDSKLQLRPYLTFDTPLQAIELSPDRKLMLIEVEKIAPPEPAAKVDGPSLANTGLPSDTDMPVAPRPKHTEMILLQPGEKTAIASSEARHAFILPLNHDGFIEQLEGKDPNQWLLRKNYLKGDSRDFGTIRSACAPDLEPLSESVVLTVHCAPNRTLGNHEVTAVSIDKGILWKDEWSDKYTWSNFESATDGSRFAFESIEMSRPMGTLDTPDEDNVKGQPVGVFDTESGKLELVENASPVLSGGRNYALSSDGRRFAILRDGAIEIYDLPPVAAGEPATNRADAKKK